MLRQPLRSCGLLLLPVLSAIPAGCAPEEPATGWEEFRRSAVPHPVRDDVWTVEGDLRIHGEAALRDYYERHVASPEVESRAWVDRNYGDHLRVLDPERKLSITYCVSDDFGVHKPTVVAQLAAAARDWERAADVNFIYRPQFDADCTAGDDAQNLWFAVTRIPNQGVVCANSVYPGESEEYRVFEITEKGLIDPICELTSGHLMRHELGHVLGLRHEHARADGCVFEGGTGSKYLSEFDVRSVMGYPTATAEEDCTTPLHTTISRRDAAGVGFLYNGVRDGWLAKIDGTNTPQWSNYQSLGSTKDIYWYEPPTTGNNDALSFGTAGGIAAWLLSAAAPGQLHRPIPGRFSSDHRWDVLFYSEGSDELDKLFVKASGDDLTFTSYDAPIIGLRQPLVGQFTGSVFTDIFWYGPGPEPDLLWEATGAVSPPFFTQHVVSVGDDDAYYVPLVGNFDGDGDSDIFFYHPDTQAASSSAWLRSNGDGTFQTIAVNHAGKGIVGNESSLFFYSHVLGDFNGNGFHDIFWYAPGQSPSARFWAGGVSGPGTGYNFTATAPVGDYKVYSGDFNGDGKTDLLWHDQSGTDDKVWQMSGTSFAFTEYAVNLGTDEANLVIGDFDADGKADVYSWDPVGTDRLYRSSGNGVFSNPYSAAGPQGYPVGHGRS